MTTSYCRLFLVAPVTSNEPELLAMAKACIEAGDIACVLLNLGENVQPDLNTTKLISLFQQADIAVVLDGDGKRAAALHADGVQLENPVGEDIKRARSAVGEDAIVGARVGGNRHAAMVAGEAGASYVAFSSTGDEEPVGHWWAKMFEVPCVQHVADEHAARAAISAGVEFIAPQVEQWSDAARMVARYNAVIEELEGVSR